MAQIRCGIIGLGYVGLPLAMEMCRAGYHVVGVDSDQRKIDQLAAGRSYIGDISDEDVGSVVNEGLFTPTSKYAKLSSTKYISVCVPTPLSKTMEPDMSYVTGAGESIAQILQPGQTIILESTVYPGATEDSFLPILEKSRLKAGEDFYLAFSPERVDPSNRAFRVRDIPKLVGGINPASTRMAVDFYQSVFTTVVPLNSAKEAELAKLLENTYRAVNIGLANEIAMMAHDMGVDYWNVIDAAATKPFGFTPFYPGPGWGGHCIPVDPFYLSWKAKANGSEIGFIDHAGVINNRMPKYVVNRVDDLLNRHGKSIRGSNLLVLGVAYKRNVSDVRESPALDIISRLAALGANVSYHDPLVPSFTYHDTKWCSQAINAKVLSEQDCAVIVTDHACVDYQHIVECSNLIFDARNATKLIRQGNEKIEVL